MARQRANSGAVAIETESRLPLRTRPVLRRKGLPFQARIVVLALAGGLPALIAAFVLLSDAPIADSVHRLIVVVLLGVWIGFALAVRRATVEPMRSLANLLEALRGGDYSVRGRHARKGDALGDIVLEANRLGATLRSQRFEALEASALLKHPAEGRHDPVAGATSSGIDLGFPRTTVTLLARQCGMQRQC